MASNKNNYMDLVDNDNDFGFSFSDEEEIIENHGYSTLQEEVDDLKKRLVALNKIFRPLLENLAKDPDKPMIKWPNRKDIIEKQIKKLDTLTKV